jgi:hypothetical protein
VPKSSMREFAISFDESASFARLSGDFNPLHVDPVRARRTQYGRTVVHGVHALLRALDGVGEAMSLDRFEPIAIACTFSGPIATDAVVRVDARLNASSDKLRLVGETGGRSAFSLTVDLQPARAGKFDRVAGSDFEPVAPRTQAMPAPGQEETSPIQLASARYSSLFPWLARGCNADWVGDLIATTRIIGMECPGMHSIYSGFKLRRSTGASVNAERMRYRVEKSDPRFRLVRLSVAGAVLEGTVEAFLRPAPVDQQSLADICSKVGETSFLGQRALVIGGSRGLGELTAKILLAGGGDVTITYALGRDDAQRISDEAKALGRRCSTMHLDVTAPMPEVMAKSLSATGFSHVYFFASPQISKNRAGRWDHELFDSFCRVYLRAFAMVAEVVLSGEKHLQDPVRMFFPSTIFLDRPEDGFAEYCSSKAAGEALCDYFAGKHRAVFARPRLPRMRTDQTSGLSSFDAEEPFAVMHPVLLGFRSASRDPGA